MSTDSPVTASNSSTNPRALLGGIGLGIFVVLCFGVMFVSAIHGGASASTMDNLQDICTALAIGSIFLGAITFAIYAFARVRWRYILIVMFFLATLGCFLAAVRITIQQQCMETASPESCGVF